MTQSHTPLPWQKKSDMEWNVIIGNVYGPDDYSTICDCDIFDNKGDEQKANADLILKAANCHYELVEALENTLKWMEQHYPVAYSNANASRAALEKAKAGAA